MGKYKLLKGFPCYGGVDSEFQLQAETMSEAMREVLDLMNLWIVPTEEGSMNNMEEKQFIVRVEERKEDGTIESLVDKECDSVLISTASYREEGDRVAVDATNACLGRWHVESHIKAIKEQQDYFTEGVKNCMKDALQMNDPEKQLEKLIELRDALKDGGAS